MNIENSLSDSEHLEKACNWNEDTELVTHFKDGPIFATLPGNYKKNKVARNKKIICSICGCTFYISSHHVGNTKRCLDCKLV